MGQLAHRLVALEHRGEEDADGARVRVAVGVAADLAVHRADVEAGPAAQAVERLPQGGGDLARAAVVEQDQVELLRPLELPRPPRPAHERRVGGELLTGRAPGQDGQEHHQVGHGRDHLLHAHEGHVDAGQRGHHAPVALVGDQHDGAGLGDGEVRARDGHADREELLAQVAPRRLGDRLREAREHEAHDGYEHESAE